MPSIKYPRSFNKQILIGNSIWNSKNMLNTWKMSSKFEKLDLERFSDSNQIALIIIQLYNFHCVYFLEDDTCHEYWLIILYDCLLRHKQTQKTMMERKKKRWIITPPSAVIIVKWISILIIFSCSTLTKILYY